MIRKILCSFALVGGLALATGCDTAKDAAKDAGKAAAKAGSTVATGAGDVAKGAGDTVKGGVDAVGDAAKSGLGELTKLTEGLPEIEKKIEGLTGEPKTKAGAMLAEVKKLIDDAKTAVTSPEKWKSAFEAVKTKFAELKKLVGIA